MLKNNHLMIVLKMNLVRKVSCLFCCDCYDSVVLLFSPFMYPLFFLVKSIFFKKTSKILEKKN